MKGLISQKSTLNRPPLQLSGGLRRTLTNVEKFNYLQICIIWKKENLNLIFTKLRSDKVHLIATSLLFLVCKNFIAGCLVYTLDTLSVLHCILSKCYILLLYTTIVQFEQCQQASTLLKITSNCSKSTHNITVLFQKKNWKKIKKFQQKKNK